MKVFVVVVSVVSFFAFFAEKVQCFGDTNDHPMMKTVQKICREKVPVKDEYYKRAIEKGDMQTDDRGLQCYTKCVFETAKTISEDGKIDLTGFINGMIPEAKDFYGPIMLSCQNEVEHEDLCVKTMKMYECFKQKSGDKYYFV